MTEHTMRLSEPSAYHELTYEYTMDIPRIRIEYAMKIIMNIPRVYHDPRMYRAYTMNMPSFHQLY